MVGTVSKGPYNLPSTERGVDSLTYNPQADARPDNAAFDPAADAGDVHPLAARGANTQPTNVDFEKEDREAEQSELSGKIPKAEVNDLLNSSTEAERNVSGRTRGKKVDAYKGDREVDQAFKETGLEDAEQDVEISKATGA